MFPPAPLAIISKLRLSALTSLAHSLQIRVQGWDPIYIISQIVSLQSLHYLTLSFFLPTLLYFFASPIPLDYAGGSSSISMIMDWREFLGASVSSRNTASTMTGSGKIMVETLIGLGQSEMGTGVGINYAVGTREMVDGLVRLTSSDPARGWVIAAGWTLSCLFDIIYLYHIVRRPTHILDSSLTLLFNHIILTTYFSGHFPTAIFFWFVVILSTTAQIVLAEQWCVRREMRDGFKSEINTTNSNNGNSLNVAGGDSDIELGKFEQNHEFRNGSTGSRQYERVSNMEA